MREFANKISDFFTETAVGKTILVLLIIAVLAVLLIGGIGIFGAILMVVLLGIAIYFGSIRILAGSALLATLLKLFPTTIKGFAALWIAQKSLDQLFAVVNGAGYVELIFTVFFFFYLLSFGTSCIRPRLFGFSTNVENKIKTSENEETKQGPTLDDITPRRSRVA